MRQTGKQQVRFLGMMTLLREFIDVEQHGPQHVEEPVRLGIRALPEHRQERVQHGCQRGVFFADDSSGEMGHGELR